MFKVVFSANLAVLLAYALAKETSREDCKPGYFYAGDLGCHKCPRGTYQNQSGQYGCKPCMNNTIAPKKGSTSCRKCMPRAYTDPHRTRCICQKPWRKVDGKCTDCPPGTVYRRYKEACDICPKNHFQPYRTVATNCYRCAGNAYSFEGSTKCRVCPKNKALMEDGQCRTCPPGTHYSVYNMKCNNCTRDSFQPFANIRNSCYRCAQDSYSRERASSCIRCPRLQGLMKNGKCGGCPPGQGYNRNREECQDCTSGCYSLGSKGSNDVLSPSRLCKRCARGKTSMDGAKKCVACPSGMRLMADGKCGKCPAGTRYAGKTGTCKRCQSGSIRTSKHNMGSCEWCKEGLTSNSERTKCIKCPKGMYPLEPSKKCTKCPPGTFLNYKNIYQGCTKCPGNTFTDKPNVASKCRKCPGGTLVNAAGTECSKKSKK